MPDNSSLYGSSSSTTSSTNTSGLYGNSTPTTQTVASNNTTGLYADGLPTPSISGNVTIPGNLIINGCSIITNCTDTFNLINTNATGVNFAGAATSISIGASTGTTTINNGLFVDGPGEFASAITGSVANFTTVNVTTIDADNAIIDVIGPNDTIVAITDSSGTYATLNPAGPTDATDLTTKSYVDSAVSGITVDRLVNGTKQFVLNADGSVTSPGNYNIAQGTAFLFDENNNRLNRPNFRSTTGNSSGIRVSGPNATTSASAQISAFSTNDDNNGKFIQFLASAGTTNPLRIRMGQYTGGVFGATGGKIAFYDGNTAYAFANSAGTVDAQDYATKSYVDSIPVVDTTYTIDATSTTGGANFNLVGSDSTTDTIKFAGSGSTTVTRTDANTITISSTASDPTQLVNGSYTLQLNSDGTVSFPNYTFPVADGVMDVGTGWGQVLATNGAGTLSWTDAKNLVPTYTTNVSPATGGVDVTLQAVEGSSLFTVGTTTFIGGTNVTISETSPNEITIDASATPVTTYTIDASSTTGGANLNLTGSDASVDTVKYSDGTGVTITAPDASTIEVAIGQDVGTTADVQFNTVNFAGQSTVSWEPNYNTLTYTTNGISAEIGQDIVKVKNETGSTVTKGTVVRILGSTGTNMTVGLADNSAESTSASSIGFAAQNINNNATGLIFTNNYLSGLDTSAIAAGTPIWLGTSGQYTSTKPVAPAHLVFLGWIVRSHATEGVIYINVQNGWELDELHNVKITSPVDGQVLTYDSATGLWINETPAAGAVDSVNGQTGVVVLDTDDISEGSTNLYFTDARARSAIANGTDIVDGGAGDVYVGSLRDNTRVLGTLEATRDASYTFPTPASSLVDGYNGFEVASSSGGPNNYGYAPTINLNYYQGDTASGNQSAPNMTYRTAAGPNTTPTAVQSTNVLGTLNFDGYATTNFASNVATTNGGGGRIALVPLQWQAYANETFAEANLSLATTAAIQSNVALTSVVSSGSGVFTNASADVRQYDVIRVTGTLTGTMTFPGYVSGNLYYVTAGANPTTTFTISATQDGTPVATTAGTTTGLTFTRCRSIITYAAQTSTPFGQGSTITVAGLTPSGYNGTFRATFNTTTQVGYGNYHASGSATVQGTVSQDNVSNGGMGYRIRAFPSAQRYNTSNRINLLDHNASTATYRSDSHIWQGATNTFQYMNLNAAGGSFNVGTLSVKDLAGTSTYFTAGSLAVKPYTPFRYNLTAAGNFAAGATYTPASTVTNSISATINSGASATFTVAVTNLKASATEGGHYQISVTNSSGNIQTVTTSGCNTNPSVVLANGASCCITIYVVGTLAFAEILT